MVYSLSRLKTIKFLPISFLQESLKLEEELMMGKKREQLVTREGIICFYALHFLF